MAKETYRYAIIGGGLAGASAIDGIRERDKDGPILLIGAENQLPYNRPPLSKGLWFGKKKVEDVFHHDQAFYDQNGVALRRGARVATLDCGRKALTTADGAEYIYEKLLLATGGTPRRLPVPGGELPDLIYYRTLDDYARLRERASEGKSAVIIGGGFIGSELAAALTLNRIPVTLILSGPRLVPRVFPEDLGRALTDEFASRGVAVLAGERATAIAKDGERFVTTTGGGKRITSDLVVVGVGIEPGQELAAAAGLETGNGIVVNERLQTSDPDVYAAGDNAFFPYPALSQPMRIEHWDNALNQGQWAGRNMAGANEPYTYMPYFFSDLFEFGYEAVGEVDTELATWADWQEENRKGVIYFHKQGKVRGAMMCNVWDKVEAARELIRAGAAATPENLRGAIR